MLIFKKDWSYLSQNESLVFLDNHSIYGLFNEGIHFYVLLERREFLNLSGETVLVCLSVHSYRIRVTSRLLK